MSARRMELKLSHQACVLPVSVFVVDGAFGHRGLALSTAVAAMVNFLILYGMMSRHAGTLDTRRFLGTLTRCALAAGVLGLICWLGLSFGAMWLGSPLLIVRALSLLVLVGVAGLAYFAICLGLRVEEIQDAVRIVERKLRR